MLSYIRKRKQCPSSYLCYDAQGYVWNNIEDKEEDFVASHESVINRIEPFPFKREQFVLNAIDSVREQDEERYGVEE